MFSTVKFWIISITETMAFYAVCDREGRKLVTYFETLKNNWIFYRVNHKLSWFYEMVLSELFSILHRKLVIFLLCFFKCLDSNLYMRDDQKKMEWSKSIVYYFWFSILLHILIYLSVWLLNFYWGKGVYLVIILHNEFNVFLN